MVNNNNTQIDFYKHLGYLFYAIIASDKRIKNEELKKLEDTINTKWEVITKSQKEVNLLTEIKSTVNNLIKENNDANSAFEAFINYKAKNELLFTKNIKYLILKTASDIASACAGHNKSELILLAKLDLNFKKSN